MKTKSTLAALTAVLITGFAHGATGIFGSHLEIFASTSTATTTTIYKGEGGTPPNFDGATLGTFNLTDVLNISRSEISTWKNGSSDVTGGNLNYRVYLTGGSQGSFLSQSYGFKSNGGINFGGQTLETPGDQLWGSNTSINVMNLTNGNGNYTLEVFFRSTTANNEGDRFSSNGGNNFKASFTVVPEPTSSALGLIGAVLLLRRRR